MRDEKWTPGPWQASGMRSSQPAGAKFIQVGPDGTAIAGVYFSDRTPKDFIASHADAHLIAAAPTLYEELAWYEEIAEGCRKPGMNGDTYRGALALDGGRRARAALARARGETPPPPDPTMSGVPLGSREPTNRNDE